MIYLEAIFHLANLDFGRTVRSHCTSYMENIYLQYILPDGEGNWSNRNIYFNFRKKTLYNWISFFFLHIFEISSTTYQNLPIYFFHLPTPITLYYGVPNNRAGTINKSPIISTTALASKHWWQIWHNTTSSFHSPLQGMTQYSYFKYH